MSTARLELRHLVMVRAITECGGVTRAADRLGITQSALTHRLREAERRLDAPLFSRVGRRLRLTAAGERLYATAVVVVDELERAEADVRSLADRRRTVVRFGQGTYSRFHWVPAFLRFLDEPDLELDIVARATPEPLACVLDGSADVVVVHGVEQETRRLRWHRLANDPLVAIMAPTHPLAGKCFVEASDFVNERYITYSLEPAPGFEWQRLFRSARSRPRRISKVGTPEAIIDLVRAGYGVSILSRWAVEPEIAEGSLVARPVGAEGLDLNWWTVVRTEESPGSPASRVAAAMARWSGSRDDKHDG